MNIPASVNSVMERIAAAAASANRAPGSVRLVAVTKTVDAACAKQVLDAGVSDLGENRVQCFLDKYEALGDAPRWHLIGHLQTNKVKYVVGKVSLIHSVDTLHLAEAISAKAVSAGICQDILLQFNISGEASKSGAAKEEALHFAQSVSALPGVTVRGLMTMAPLLADEAETRAVFSGLRTLSEKIAAEKFPGVFMEELSMGMSGDFEAAIKEGATLVRVGSALFRD
ncbi:MAG: YggS family pyridoxal phosphate-dependent enzyme [Ruminococcaceae bacterium]|nr:YggS family pyridoxal phosphate-dependent enzyme [Oscillospiraceae bacterium]